MKFFRTFLTAGTIFAWTATAYAHPGHHIEGFVAGFSHPLGGLDHLLAMIAIGLWAGQLGGKAALGVPFTCLAMIIIAAGLAATGQWVPITEAGIVMSVIMVGAAVALKLKLPLMVALTAVGIFGLCHGYAHGVEMQANAGRLLYGMGFVLASSLLLGLGLVLSHLKGHEKLTCCLGSVIALIGVVFVF